MRPAETSRSASGLRGGMVPSFFFCAKSISGEDTAKTVVEAKNRQPGSRTV
jgi:hypothetical protein